MHPGYSFTGDNVDMRCTPWQVTLKNRNKDHHMFLIVAFKNRVSSNHLPADKPKRNIKRSLFQPSFQVLTSNPYYRETSMYLWDINGPGYSFPVLDERLFTLPHKTKLYGSGMPERAKVISSVGQKCGK